jgi:superfamily II DNA or RNA helicase
MSVCVIKVDSRLRLFLDSLTPEVAEEIRSAFTHVNPAYLLKKRLGIPAWSEPPTYRTHTTEEGVLSLPRGGMAKVRTILQANGYTWTIQDTRVTGKVVKAGLIPPTKMVLRDYQEEMMAAAFKKENCLLRAGTGSGKSTVAIAFASKVGLYTLVIVWSAALFEQWMDRIESELGVPRSEIGIIKGSTTKIRPITMAMQQTISARGEDNLPLDTFGAIIMDEVQRAPAAGAYKAIDMWPAKYRIGISADEKRKDGKEFLLYDLFGAVAIDVKRDDLVDEGSILEVEVRIVPTDFKADWYKEDHDFNRLLHEMMDSNDRDTLIIQHAQDEIDKGEQLFVLSHRREHCHTLAKRLGESAKVGLLLGGPSDVEAFGETKRGMDSGVTTVGVGTIQAIAQGLDIPRIGRIVVCTPMASNKQLFGQARGRVCRTAIKEGKKDAKLYYLWDQHVYGLKHVENLLAWNRKVLIKEKGEWVPAREWLKSAKNPRDIEGTNFEFLESLDNAE